MTFYVMQPLGEKKSFMLLLHDIWIIALAFIRVEKVIYHM